MRDQPPPGGGATRMNDPPGAMTPFETERELAVRTSVELDPEGLKAFHYRGRLLAEHPRRRCADRAAAGENRVAKMKLGAVLR